MKPKHSLRNFMLLTGSIVLTLSSANAQSTLTWDANGATALQTDGAGAWLNTSQWWNGSTNVNWTSGDHAVFGNGGTGGAITLASPTTVGSLTFNYFTGTAYTLGTAGQAITLDGGITRNSGAGTVAFASNLILGGAQTWANNSYTQYSAKGGINLNGNALTIGGVGNTDLGDNTANIITGAGGMVKNGTGRLILSASGTVPLHNFTGALSVNGGQVAFQNSAFFANVNTNLNGGVLAGRFGSGRTWDGLGETANQIRITGGESGFSGEGTSGSTFQIGGALSTLTWGSTYFNPGVLVLGAINANNNGVGSLNNAIDLSGATRTITSTQITNGAAGSGFTLSGAITTSSGTAGLTKTGVGNLILVADNTYNGATTIRGGNISAGSNPASNTAAGSITLSGANGRLSGTSGLNLANGGTLRMVNTNAQNTVDRLNNAAIAVTNGGGISWENTAGANSFGETIGSVTLSSGQFNVNLATNQTGAGSQTLTLGGLTRNGTSSATFSAATTGPEASGNKNMIVVSGAGSTNANEIIGSWATTGTAVNAQTDYAVYNGNHVTAAGIAASAQSSWTTAHAATSNYTMSALASGTLSATRNINSLRSTNNSVAVTASDANIALAGHALVVGDVVTFSAGTMPTGLAAGTPYYVVATGAGTIQVSATDGGGAITPTTAGTAVVAAGGIKLSTGNNLGTTGILNGSAAVLNIMTSGTGSITLPTSGAGQLHINTGCGSISNNAPIIDNGGALTLVKSGNGGATLGNGNITTTGTLVLNGVNTYTGDTIINAGVLRVGTNGTANGAKLGGASGIYAGNITIDAGAMLWISTNANQTLSGIISGEGALMKSYSGTLTLGNNNTYTGRTSISPSTTAGAGILEVTSLNSVVGGTASSSLGAPTTVFNGTIDLGGPASIQGPATLRYLGGGETTDRVVNIVFGNNTTRTLDASGSGLLRFTSAFTNSGTDTNGIILQGTGNGQIDQGLSFAFNNLTKSGAGTWTLGGAVGSAGTLTISANGGTLALQRKSSLMGGNTANWTAAKVIVNNNATLALNVGGDGEFNTTDITTVLTNLGGLGGAINNNGLRSGSRIGFDTTNATGTFTIADNITNATGTGSGAIGLNKRGTGTLELTGTNSYTGATTVSAGTLLINGNSSTAVGAVSVAAAGTIGGIGTVGGNTTVNGTLSPGASPGTLTFAGSLSLASTATYYFEGGDLTNVTTTLTLTNDWTLALGLGLQDGGSVTLFNYGSIGGSPDLTPNFNVDDLTFTPSGPLTLTDTGSSIVLNGVSFIPEPSTALLGALGAMLLLRRRR